MKKKKKNKKGPYEYMEATTKYIPSAILRELKSEDVKFAKSHISNAVEEGPPADYPVDYPNNYSSLAYSDPLFPKPAQTESTPPEIQFGNVKSLGKQKPVFQRVAYDQSAPTGYPADDALTMNDFVNGEQSQAPRYATPKYAYASKPVQNYHVIQDYSNEVGYGTTLPEMHDSEAKDPSDIEQFENVRDSFRILRSSDRTMVYCVIVDKEHEKNVVAGLRCYGGIAFGGYARDVSDDSYLVECVQAVLLGNIPFNFKLEIPNTGKWSVNIPIPEKVLIAAFTPEQRKILLGLRDSYPEKRYQFQFLQMLMAN